MLLASFHLQRRYTFINEAMDRACCKILGREMVPAGFELETTQIEGAYDLWKPMFNIRINRLDDNDD